MAFIASAFIGAAFVLPAFAFPATHAPSLARESSESRGPQNGPVPADPRTVRTMAAVPGAVSAPGGVKGAGRYADRPGEADRAVLVGVFEPDVENRGSRRLIGRLETKLEIFLGNPWDRHAVFSLPPARSVKAPIGFLPPDPTSGPEPRSGR